MGSRLLVLSAVGAGAALFLALSFWPEPQSPALTSAAEIHVEPERAVRNVTPPGITQGPAADGPLVRIATPEPPPSPPQPAAWHRFFQPVAVSAGSLRLGEHSVSIAGIAAPGADQACRDGEGAEWPCGPMALTALRQMLRGRAVECQFEAGGEMPAALPCRVGTTDLALWLVANGWAEPGDGAPEPLRRAFHAAQCARLGLWRDRQEAGCEDAAVAAGGG